MQNYLKTIFLCKHVSTCISFSISNVHFYTLVYSTTIVYILMWDARENTFIPKKIWVFGCYFYSPPMLFRHR